MTSREYRYLKADRLLNYFGDIFPVPNKHWHLRRRIARMTQYEYIRWKNQQDSIPPQTDAALWEIRHDTFVPGKACIVASEMPRTVDLRFQFNPEFLERIDTAFKEFTEKVRNAKPDGKEE
jgi:hypothetical protein